MRFDQLALGVFFKRWGFLTPPEIPADPQRDAAFKALWSQAEAGQILDYRLPYPKSWFTCWLTANQPVLLHGSNRGGLEELTPRPQTNFSGKRVEGVFASSDGIWPLFFAAINYQNPKFRVTRNGCFTIGADKFYCFNISEEAFEGEVWTPGWVYVLPAEGFVSQDPGGLWQDEWVCPHPVRPLAVLSVSAEDFPFKAEVVGFPQGEGVLQTWRKYGRRRANAVQSD